MIAVTVYFPSGRPAPPLLTEQEVIELLRLDTCNIKDPSETLRRYRDSGLLRGAQVSRRIFYRLESVLRFIEAQEEAVRR